MSGPKRGPEVSEAGHQAAIKARLDRLAREAEAEAEVERIFDEAVARGIETTPQAIRQALAERKAAEVAEARARQTEAARGVVAPARPRGRSRWTATLFATRWAEACEKAGEPYSFPHVAPWFVWLDDTTKLDADPEYLGRLWRKWGRPRPAP